MLASSLGAALWRAASGGSLHEALEGSIAKAPPARQIRALRSAGAGGRPRCRGGVLDVPVMVDQAGKPLDLGKLHGTVAELAGQLQFVNEKVVQYYPEVLTEHGAGHLRRVAAASLIRVPNW